MVVVSLIPLGVLFHISSTYVFGPLNEQGETIAIYAISATLGLTALVVVLGYVLVRRDTVRTIQAISSSEQLLQQLYEATESLASLDAPEAVRQTLLDAAETLTGAQRAGLWLRTGDQLDLVSSSGISAERGAKIPLPVGQGLVGRAASEGATLRDQELTDTDRSWDERVRTKTDSSLVVPLFLGDVLVAVLDLRNKAEASRFTANDQSIAEALGRQATQFLDNAGFRDTQTEFEKGSLELVKALTDQHLCWQGHVDNVVGISLQLAERLDLSEEKREALEIAAIVHDIGLLDFPRVDIGPPGGPVDHSERGAVRLSSMPFWAAAEPIVRAHHEQMDGSGPLGLRGFAIPMAARILALAEYVDTVTNPNSPWGDKTVADVAAEISGPDDKRFDPSVVQAFCAQVGRPGAKAESLPEVEVDPSADPWAGPGAS